MNESSKNTTWYRAVKILYIWSFVIMLIVATSISINESFDIQTFITAFVILNSLVLIIFFAIKKSFFYIMFGNKQAEIKKEVDKNIVAETSRTYTNEIGQSFTDEDLHEATEYAANLIYNGSTRPDALTQASEKYGIPHSVISSLLSTRKRVN
jgi:hypothetical protein